MAKQKTPYTPMMMHYLSIKEQNKDTLILYRLGDFYEMFFDDAKTASRELQLVLTGRDAGADERVPMCGVPFHAVNGYIEKLIKKGPNVQFDKTLNFLQPKMPKYNLILWLVKNLLL